MVALPPPVVFHCGARNPAPDAGLVLPEIELSRYGATTMFPCIVPSPPPLRRTPAEPVTMMSPCQLKAPCSVSWPVTTRIPPPAIGPSVQSPSQYVIPVPVALFPQEVGSVLVKSRPVALVGSYGLRS